MHQVFGQVFGEKSNSLVHNQNKMRVYSIKRQVRKYTGEGYIILHRWVHICKTQFWKRKEDAKRYLKYVIIGEHPNPYNREMISYWGSIKRPTYTI